VVLALAVVWRFLYQLQSRLQTTEPLAAVAVGVEAPPRSCFLLVLRPLTSEAEAEAEAEQEPLTLRVVLVASVTMALALLAELAQAGVLALEVRAAQRLEISAAMAVIGVQEEAPVQLSRARPIRALEARLAQRLPEIQTSLISPQAHV
jgi:hypothetical protein